MLNFIKEIISQKNELNSFEFDFEDRKFYLVSYSDRDDFFLFLQETEDNLKAWVELEKQQIEYLLNNLVLRLRAVENAPLKGYEKRFIDKNLSLILIVEVKAISEEPMWLLKSEENHIQSKKYVLCFDKKNLSELKNKIEEKAHLNKWVALDEIIRDNSSQISSGNCEEWFILLTRIYSKIPFINYSIGEDNKKELESLKQNIINDIEDKKLTDLYGKLLEYHKEDDIIEFIEKHEIK